MKYHPTPIAGLHVVEPDIFPDERGLFARTYCEEEFMRNGFPFRTLQCNSSFNKHRGTLRGMHYQVAPKEEVKLVRCTAGEIFDVVVDLRPTSATYCGWYGHTLTAKDRNALLIPAGCAHGYLTLVEDSEVFYQMSGMYAPEYARGVRWDDPVFGIAWPFEPVLMAERDALWEDFQR